MSAFDSQFSEYFYPASLHYFGQAAIYSRDDLTVEVTAKKIRPTVFAQAAGSVSLTGITCFIRIDRSVLVLNGEKIIPEKGDTISLDGVLYEVSGRQAVAHSGTDWDIPVNLVEESEN